MKRIQLQPAVSGEVRSIERPAALAILKAIHRYAEHGEGDIKPLHGEYEGLLRLRVGRHRIVLEETDDSITVHRIGDRRDIYR